MAKFLPSFSICPLIDQKHFLGVTEDNDHCSIIVTLGKNIILRFKLSDQKQLSSWTTKDKLSAPVIYDKERNQYIAIFNGELISSWGEKQSGNLKKPKKYKLPYLINFINTAPNQRPVLIFKNGTIATLDKNEINSITTVVDNVVPLDEKILETKLVYLMNNYYVTILTECKKTNKLHLVSLLKTGKRLQVHLINKQYTLSGYTVIGEKGLLITLWSDGNLFSYDLPVGVEDKGNFPGRNIMLFSNINASLPCAMLDTGSNHAVVYAADSNGEGAKLCLVDVVFGVLQAVLHLKLYTNPPRIWKVSNSYLITPVGLNLTVIPFKLDSAKLDTLIGAHVPTESVSLETVWEPVNNSSSDEDSQPLTIKEKIKCGLPESVVSEEYINTLLEEGNVSEAVKTLIKINDIPDLCVVNTLLSCLSLKSSKKELLLMKTLEFPLLNDTSTLSLLREKLTFELTLDLIEEILRNIDYDNGNDYLINWIILLLDSHYQQYLLSKNEKVLDQIKRIKHMVTELIENMSELQNFYKFLSGVLNTQVTSKSSVHYTVDKFKLY